MATAAHKGAIAFGMVYIPIQLFRTTRDYDISFNQLCKETNERVKYKKICPSCNKEVSGKDIVKGYQYEKDKYVIMTEEEIESIKTKKDKTIQILQFANLSDIDARYYEKNYYALPEKGGEKAYQLLLTALLDEDKVAIAKTVLGTKENLMALCPNEKGLIVKTLFYENEIVDPPKAIEQVKLRQEELDMAKMLIDSMTKPFVPDAYQDEYQARLRDAIANKINGQDIVVPQEEDQNMVVDLMEALQRSLNMGNAQDNVSAKSKKRTKVEKEVLEAKNEVASDEKDETEVVEDAKAKKVTKASKSTIPRKSAKSKEDDVDMDEENEVVIEPKKTAKKKQPSKEAKLENVDVEQPEAKQAKTKKAKVKDEIVDEEEIVKPKKQAKETKVAKETKTAKKTPTKKKPASRKRVKVDAPSP